MNTKVFYRDGIEETILGDVKRVVTRDGHTVEVYTRKDGSTRYFATLAGTHWCAHGATQAEAIADAMWKDPDNRPSLEELRDKIKSFGVKRKISLNEFKVLTGACSEGCRVAIKRANHDGSPLTAYEIRDKINREWGSKLIKILGWVEK